MKIKTIYVILIFINIALFAQKPRVRTIRLFHLYQNFVPDTSTEFTGSGLARVFLGDTIKWLKYETGSKGFNDIKTDLHTISSYRIPIGAAPFDYLWNQAGADTMFIYVPTKPGLYDYKCKPHTIIQDGSLNSMYGSFTVVGSSLTGINDAEIEYTSTPILYPNPAKNTVNVPLSKTIKYTLEITNSKGELLKSLKVDNTELYELDVSHLTSGFYYLNTKYCGCSTPKKGCTGASRTFKFVKE